MAVGDRAQDRREKLAGAAALRVEIEEPVALAETRQDGIPIRLAIVEPGSFADRRNRALQRVVDVGMLPESALPRIGKRRGPVELLALEAHIGDDILFGRVKDRAGLELIELLRDRGHAFGSRWLGRLRRAGRVSRGLGFEQ
jgi:hypothetical protein